MYPILLQLGPITIYSIWIFLIFGLFATLIAITKLVKSRSVKLNFLAENSLLLFFSALIVSRLVFIIRNFSYFWDQIINNHSYFDIFYIWDKGLSIWGAILGVFLVLFILCRRENENFGAWSDILITSILIGMIFGNIGTFLDGRNYGTPTNLPWGVIVETSRYAIPIHPIQIYASIYIFILSIMLVKLFNQHFFKIAGRLSLLAIASYSFLRFLDEFMRGDETASFLFLREPQYYCLIAFGISVYFLYKQFKTETKLKQL